MVRDAFKHPVPWLMLKLEAAISPFILSMAPPCSPCIQGIYANIGNHQSAYYGEPVCLLCPPIALLSLRIIGTPPAQP